MPLEHRGGDLGLKKIPILVVEDDPAVGEVLAAYLEMWDFDPALVTTMRDGIEAFLEDQTFRIVMFDNTLGRAWGRQFYEAVCAAGAKRGAVFILMTGGSVKPEDQAFFQQAKVPILDKPFDMDNKVLPVLLAAVHAIPPDRTELGPRPIKVIPVKPKE